MSSKRTKALQVSPQVRQTVVKRDKWCIRCGKVYRLEVAHYVSRGSGGLGIPQNLVLLCQECHRLYDQSVHRNTIGKFIENYLKTHYNDWDKTKLKYRRYYDQ